MTASPNEQQQLRGVPKEMRPSEHQLKTWGKYVDLSMAPNDKGAFSGWCPIHDTERKEVSALFYFKSGIMVCLASCHEGKKSMSLTNVAIRMISDAR